MNRSSLVFVALLAVGCNHGSGADRSTVLRFWAMGREGEVVQELVLDFERENPGIDVQVQQMPWTAAHEKLLTAHVGKSSPDLAQLGNTWVAEFAALEALEALDRRIESSTTLDSTVYFGGIWDTNVIGTSAYGIPWYVDTRLLFYRKDLLARAGWSGMPHTWSDWRAAMEAVKRTVGPENFAILLPLNEWGPQTILGLQAGSPLLADDATHGAFSEPAFRRAFDFYVGLFSSRLAPPVRNNEIANVYQEFGRGYFSMYITGPWNLGEFRRRLPAELQSAWAVAPLPGPDETHPGYSLAGGSSLVLFRSSRNKDAAWRLIEYLSRPDQQLRFYRLTGDLPARREAWLDTSLTRDADLAAFGAQLQHVLPTPKVPEWELIATRLQDYTEMAVRGAVPPDSALAALDREVDRVLEKRRWLLERGRLHVARAEATR